MNLHETLSVDAFLPYMRDVARCEQSLRELNLMWRTIESAAKMSCPAEARAILPAMAATRSSFADFETALVDSLVREKTGNIQAELAAKPQTVIDVVVRNLYERTADVSFLATDGDLCAFAAGLAHDRAAIEKRLRAYRDKYTVYEDILLLDTSGNVLARIDAANPVERSADPLVAATLAADGYVETFRATDLRPGRRAALVYSRRVHRPDTGAVAGVLCLCFAFDEEMEGIFRNHGGAAQAAARANLLLLDDANRVIASADPLWMPLGATVPVNRDGHPAPVVFAGRAYLARTLGSSGYQGYPGPAGWQAQMMIPLDVAFGGTGAAPPAAVDRAWSDGLLGHARSFCPPLFEILAATTMIRRVVWNVQVMTAGNDADAARLEHILEQVGETGRRSDDLFARSVRDLLATALTASLDAAGFASRLLVDLLDRNLYERANDCRWWALSPDLRTLLATRLPEGGARIERMLRHINSLYTVYTSLFVYDRAGNIVAASGEAGQPAVDAATLASVLALRGEQDYHVTPFSPSAHYGGRRTYVFHAAVRAPGDDGAIVGGIGIVFDAAVEFRAMLDGVVAGAPGRQAFFVERDGTIVAGTDPARPVGTRLDVDPALLAQANGADTTTVLVHDGRYSVVGSTMSSGYREFKNADGYRCDVVAVVLESFGAVRAHVEGAPQPLRGAARGAAYATFLVGGDLFALPAADVCEAVPAARVAPVSMGGWGGRSGVLALDGHGGPEHVWVFDLRTVLTGTTHPDAAGDVVVIRHGGRALGLAVDGLHGVARFDPADVLASPAGGGGLVRHVIRANGGTALVQVLDTGRMFDLIAQPQAA
jgi:chemotaxis signal transduction protein